MAVYQREIVVSAPSRGFHIITGKIEQALRDCKLKSGIVHLFIRHTSASLSINENADPDVRRDLETYFRKTVPDGASYYTHTLEGPDDMTAHVKNVMIGSSLQVPLMSGRLALGTWQGIYLCEHREHPSGRKIIITVNGD